MCLILFANEVDSRYRLVVAANRDELFARPTASAHEWSATPYLEAGVIAGRDISAGGTWLGVNRAGRFAAVTNYREDPPDPLPPRSRGELPTDFLAGHLSRDEYLDALEQRKYDYRGFNLLLADAAGCSYYSNRDREHRHLSRGCYGLSNQLLDCDWPKVIDGRQRLTRLMNDPPEDLTASLFELLLDQGDERPFSNSFINAGVYGTGVYGTRAATVVVMETDGKVLFTERNFGPGGEELGENSFQFSCSADS